MIRIYVNYFNEAKVISTDILTPIQVGRAIAKKNLSMLGDDTGLNISHKNPAYCELTGLFWAWKNDVTSTHMGFMHYRRFLDFNFQKSRIITENGIIEEKIDASFCEEYGLVDSKIEELTLKYDAIIPEPYDVRNSGAYSVRNQYETANFHFVRDFDKTESIIERFFPDYIKFFRQMSNGYELYPANIFILKREILIEYCNFLFQILEHLEREIDTENYNTQEKRVLGYLSERLFTVFLLKKKSDENFLFKKLNIVHVKNTVCNTAPSLPETAKQILSIVTSSDNSYVPHVSALIYSLVMATNANFYLDVLILDGGISHVNKTLIKNTFSKFDNLQVNFIDMSGYFQDIPTNAYFTRATFYRLALPELLPNRQRVLYLDSDMIVASDLSDLYHMDLDGKAIAAAPDLIMRSFVAMGVRSSNETKGLPAKIYLSDTLCMKEFYDNYFQAGTILFDLEKLRESPICKIMVNDLRNNRYWFLDQDVLNKNLNGLVKSISNKWNSIYIDDTYTEYLDKKSLFNYNESQNDPKIIHYAGIYKPWETNKNPLGYFYWNNLRHTPWYEEILLNFIMKNTKTPSIERKNDSCLYRILSSLWRKQPKALKSFLNPMARTVNKWLQK